MRPGYHTSLLGKAHLYRDEKLTVSHIDEMAGRLEELGFAEVFETGDKFAPKIPTRYTDFLAREGLLDVYRKHIADRSYQGENEDGQNATKCVPMWDATPMPLPLHAYVDTWHGQQAVRWIEDYDRSRALLPLRRFPRVPTTPGMPPRRRSSATGTSRSPCRARPLDPRPRAPGATARS